MLKSTFFRVLFHLLLALAIGIFAAWFFREVLPHGAAYALGIAVFVIGALSGFVTGRHSPGAGVRLIASAGEVVLAWPVTAALLQYFYPAADRPERIATAAIVAASLGILAARHGSGHETRRLLAIVAAVAIPLYSLGNALLSGNRIAVALACAAVGIGAFAAGFAHLWPDRHHQHLLTVTAVCMVAAAVTLLTTWL